MIHDPILPFVLRTSTRVLAIESLNTHFHVLFSNSYKVKNFSRYNLEFVII